jgi:predicted transcriptional regulator
MSAEPETPHESSLSAEEIFERAPNQFAALFGWFFLQHFGELYSAFEGDMLMPIILGEIAHHNICHYYSRGRRRKGKNGPDPKAANKNEHFEPCNALSLSVATGIPRETCRRKIRKLEQQRFIQLHPNGGYIISDEVSEHFVEMNRQTFRRFLVLIEEFNDLISSIRQ